VRIVDTALRKGDEFGYFERRRGGATSGSGSEAVSAVVVLKPGQGLELEQLREFAGARLARYKLPSRLEIVPALPRNAAGKVLKTQLREQFGGIGDAAGN
jgi:acyl-CoA synthetase (AMP-forming)/AMP-acid ligase II